MKALRADEFHKVGEQYVIKTLNGGYFKGTMCMVDGMSCYITDVQSYMPDPEMPGAVLCEETDTAMIPLSAIACISPEGRVKRMKHVSKATESPDQSSPQETQPDSEVHAS